jgi:hypothetical protein
MPDDAIHLLQLSACLALGLVVVFFRRSSVRSGPRALLANVLPVLGFVLLREFC